MASACILLMAYLFASWNKRQSFA